MQGATPAKLLRYLVIICMCMCVVLLIVILKHNLKTNPAVEKPPTPTVACSQETRKCLLSTQCKIRPVSYNSTLPRYMKDATRFIIDDKHKLVYCATPKTACTTMKILMLNISSNGSLRNWPLHSENLRKLHYFMEDNQYSKYQLRQQKEYTNDLDSYTKLLIVRHPFTRLVSAYRDKILVNDPSFKELSQNIVKFFRPKAANQTEVYPTFKEFITVFLHNTVATNEHVIPYFSICKPCIINYDYILRTETLKYELKDTLNKIYGRSVVQKHVNNFQVNKVPEHKIQQSIDMNRNYSRARNQKTRDRFQHYLSEFESLSDEDLRLLEERFRDELFYYGYTFDSSFHAGCRYKYKDICPQKLCC